MGQHQTKGAEAHVDDLVWDDEINNAALREALSKLKYSTPLQIHPILYDRACAEVKNHDAIAGRIRKIQSTLPETHRSTLDALWKHHHRIRDRYVIVKVWFNDVMIH